MFTGFDVDAWDDHIPWMWQWSNLRFIGFYLAHGADNTTTTWTSHWHDLRDIGFGIVPIWLPFGSGQIMDMATADGNAHGLRAADRAEEAHVEHGATLYLDIEAPVFGAGADDGFTRYIVNWASAVRSRGYLAGAYCSRLDAPRLLGRPPPTRPTDTRLRDLGLSLYPFSIPGPTRAQWDDRRFQLKPATAETWDVGNDPTWAVNPRTVACQYDWFNDQRDRQIFHWPSATGAQDTFRSVDWDMSKAFDPAHPAAGAVAATPDRGAPDWVRIYCVGAQLMQQAERNAAGRLLPGTDLARGPGDIGPPVPPELAGFDAASAAVTSRRSVHFDLFVLGQDGLVRTMWDNPVETHPRHPWAINPDRPARRGSAIAAVSREADQIDVFYVDRSHRLVTQWWSPIALDWARNHRVVGGPLVAGGSNLLAIGHPASAGQPGRLEVLYVSLDFAVPRANPTWQTAAWQVVLAEWSTASDWQSNSIPGLEGAASASGVAACHDSQGALHVVVQRRNRQELRYAVRPTGTTQWTTRDAPNSLQPTATRRARWWVSLQLMACGDALLLAGMVSDGSLAWCHWANGGWSAVSTGEVRFATCGRLSLALRGNAAVDVLALDEQGNLAMRSLERARGGTFFLLPAR